MTDIIAVLVSAVGIRQHPLMRVLYSPLAWTLLTQRCRPSHHAMTLLTNAKTCQRHVMAFADLMLHTSQDKQWAWYM